MPIDLSSLGGPRTASIFASDPAALGQIVSFILTDIAVPVPNRVRLDLLRGVSASRRLSPARSPLERSVIDNLQLEPETITVQGSLSATPLGPVGVRLGAFGSAIRRDFRELAKLRKLQARREPVVLVIPARVYLSVAMTSIDESHDGSHKVDLSITFEEVRIISPITVAGSLDISELQSGAGSTQNSGAQATSSVDVDVGGGLG